jgi:hypothetical protein
MYAHLFDRLFERGRDAVLRSEHARDTPPADGDERWGISVVFRPDPEVAAALDAAAGEAMAYCGPGHWPTGAVVASHFTVRSLEGYRDPVPDGDAAVARYAAAVARAAARRPGPVRLAMTGVTLTPTSVMCSAEPVDAAAGELATALGEELGPDGWHEADFNRDIWYANLVHFTGPIADPEGLVGWAADRRRRGFGETKITEIELMRWAYDGRQVVPVELARSAL